MMWLGVTLWLPVVVRREPASRCSGLSVYVPVAGSSGLASRLPMYSGEACPVRKQVRLGAVPPFVVLAILLAMTITQDASGPSGVAGMTLMVSGPESEGVVMNLVGEASLCMIEAMLLLGLASSILNMWTVLSGLLVASEAVCGVVSSAKSTGVIAEKLLSVDSVSVGVPCGLVGPLGIANGGPSARLAAFDSSRPPGNGMMFAVGLKCVATTVAMTELLPPCVGLVGIVCGSPSSLSYVVMKSAVSVIVRAPVPVRTSAAFRKKAIRRMAFYECLVITGSELMSR